MTTTIEPVVLCGKMFYKYVCELKPQHEGDVHRCECGGSWNDAGDILEFPDPKGESGLLPPIKATWPF